MDQDRDPAANERIPAKRFGRRRAMAAIGAVAASAALPLQARQAARRPPGTPPAERASPLRPLAPPGAPRALSRDDLDTLGCLVETIIPATDTPGARDAGVHTFLDDVASVDPGAKHELTRIVARAQATAMALHGRPYATLEAAHQDAVMEALSTGTPADRAAFTWLKRRVVDAYYRSEIGQIGELHWVGHEFHSTFPGACTHDDPLTHPRSSWPRPAVEAGKP